MEIKDALKKWMTRNEKSVLFVADKTKLSVLTLNRFLYSEKPTSASSQELIRLFLESQKRGR